MASMDFDSLTVTNLMSLVDEHKEEFKEGEYLKLCNIMKFLYNQVQTRSNMTSHTPAPFTVPSVVPIRLTNRAVADGIRRTIIHLQNSLSANGRVTVQDKLDVLNDIFRRNSISISFDSTSTTRTQLVNQMECRLKEMMIVNVNYLHNKYQTAKRDRLQRERSRVQNQIREQQIRLESLSSLPPNDPYTGM